MDSSIKYWKAAKSFFKRNRYMISANASEHMSDMIPFKNDGRTLHFHHDDKSFIASNVGNTDVLIKYDVRPNETGYKFIDGRYVPHPRGDIKIEGYYPNYRIAGLFIPVFIGPHLYFYPNKQEDILYLATSGQLNTVVVSKFRRCLTCERDIPMELGARAKYCSVECGLVTRDMLRRKRAARAEEKKFTLPKITLKRKCQNCGGDMPKGSAGRALYCSVECGLLTRDMSPPPKTYPCDYCGGLFSRKGPQRFCSETCKLKDKIRCLES